MNNLKNYIKCINGNWYAFSSADNSNSVYSLDYRYLANGFSDNAIKYVGVICPSRHAAYMRCVRAGGYDGCWE